MGITRGRPGTSSTSLAENVSAPSNAGGRAPPFPTITTIMPHSEGRQSSGRIWMGDASPDLGPGLESLGSSAELISTRAPTSCSRPTTPM